MSIILRNSKNNIISSLRVKRDPLFFHQGAGCYGVVNVGYLYTKPFEIGDVLYCMYVDSDEILLGAVIWDFLEKVFKYEL